MGRVKRETETVLLKMIARHKKLKKQKMATSKQVNLPIDVAEQIAKFNDQTQEIERLKKEIAELKKKKSIAANLRKMREDDRDIFWDNWDDEGTPTGYFHQFLNDIIDCLEDYDDDEEITSEIEELIALRRWYRGEAPEEEYN